MSTFKHLQTLAVRTQAPRSSFMEHSTALHLTSSFLFENAEDMRSSFNEEKEKTIYSRYTNPTVDEFTSKMVLLEGAEAGYSFSSGMAAIYSTLAALLKSGDHVLCCHSVFGATLSLLNKYFVKFGVESSYFRVQQQGDLSGYLRPTTKILFIETPTNPGVEILDIAMMARFAKKHGLILIVDNCFATPVLQRPLQLGADLVVHSATKLIDGQGRVLGGVVVGKSTLVEEIYQFARISGSCLSPFNAWVLSKSLETLYVRVEKHSENALEVARFLEQHSQVEMVRYPFLASHPQYSMAREQMTLGGSIVAFSLKAGTHSAQGLIDALEMLSISANLGDTRSIITHPASSTHSKLTPSQRADAGITENMLRLSVGLEHPEDIIEDLRKAMEKITK